MPLTHAACSTHPENIPLADGGLMYAETNLDWIIPEPWNAISSLAFLVPVFYWFLKVRHDIKSYPFLIVCMVLLLAGGIGSTLFHGLRTSPLLLMMDVLPIQFLTVLVSIYFWYKVLPKWHYTIPVIMPFLLARIYIFQFTDTFSAINIAYFITGVMIFLPALIFLVKTRFQYAHSLFLGIFFFIVALLFRQYDHEFAAILPMGSHWLWHVFGAMGAGYLGAYLYRVNGVELSKAVTYKEVRTIWQKEKL
ncbi:hypothetical protein RCC89_04040 [Cytophagaceae bacterium ABcell3]|nr:hypothetical protein RCC89_04040 [Cytophagaceae bacterium ABcell3]